ncbi:MAG TPA: cell division ATP-binding protein FtsE [Gemmatimonadales bacterium]|nr:cell division ATP-binding protein FtsE [Gemmatimonadales bacterium]
MIRFSEVTKRYNRDHVALDNVSLFIGRGEFVFFTGASGAGKSTLLKHVYFAERPGEGEVRVGGYMSDTASRREVAQLRRKLGVVFQDFRLLDDRTAEANVAFALEVIGTPRKQIGPRVARALSQVGLTSKGTALPSELSGGEQQRVAIARAIVNDPFVLVADEPTGNLDERATNAIFQLLRDINAAGTAVLMATHDLSLVRSTEYRTVELEHGKVIADSRPNLSTARSESF